jgi:predicted nuclease of predicted toxin-antitoxin system
LRIKLDENFGARWIRFFVEAGHDASTIPEEGLSGASDEEVFQACVRERRTLFTLDLDFANPLRFPPDRTEGILVLRPRRLAFAQIETVLGLALREAGEESVKGSVWIVEPTRVRKYTGERSAEGEEGG